MIIGEKFMKIRVSILPYSSLLEKREGNDFDRSVTDQITLEKDPKKELIDRLETYLRIKQAAERLGKMQVLERDTFNSNVSLGDTPVVQDGYDAALLKDALYCIFNRPEPVTHKIEQEAVLLEERIAYIEYMTQSGNILGFKDLLRPSQGRMGMVVTFMAILELTRQQKVQIVSSGIETPLTIQGSHA